MPGHALFDLNGTLFDTAPLAEPLGGTDTDRKLVGTILEHTVTLAMAETMTGSYRDFSELLEAAAAPRLELEGRGEVLPAILEAVSRMRPFPHGVEAVRILRDAGYGVGVLTNSSTATAESLLAAAGLELAPVIGSEQVESFKPDRRLYEHAVSELGCERTEVVLISAHWWDALGAKRAGLRSAWSAHKEGERVAIDPLPDYRGDDLAAVATAITGG